MAVVVPEHVGVKRNLRAATLKEKCAKRENGASTLPTQTLDIEIGAR